MRAAVLFIAVLSLLLCTRETFAQAPANPGAANALFEEGIKLRNEGKHKLACEKFEASQELDAARGTLYNIGLCLDKQGKIATSLATFQRLLDQAESAQDTERIVAARKYIKRLTGRVPTLKILAPKKVPEGMSVSTERGPIPSELLGLDTPMNPGEYTISVEAPGYKTRTYSVQLKERDAQTVKLKRLRKSKRTATAKETTPTRQVDSGHVAIALGVSHFLEDGLSPLGPAIESSVAFRVGKGASSGKLGLSLGFARHSWDENRQGGDTDAFTAQVHAAFVHAFSAQWGMRFRAGLGAMVLVGLDEPGHPWVDPSVEATGSIVLPQGSLQLGIVRTLTERVSLQWIPAQVSISPDRKGFADDVRAILAVRSLLSMEYHY